MSQPLISVIVPAYKVEDYLDRCVQSIRNQTYENLEILLVDDGSPDRCGEMCDAYAKEDPRIRVIHKENGGLSSARNAGLDQMTGEYVGFVDSDDLIDPEMYSTLYAHMIEADTQVAACAVRCDSPEGELLWYLSGEAPEGDVRVFAQEEALRELIRAVRISNSVCDKLFSRAVFEKRRFTVGIVNEDYEMMPSLIAQSPRVVYVPVAMYHYTMTSESITRGTFKESRFTETDISRRHLAFYRAEYPALYADALAKHVELALVLIHLSAGEARYAARRKELIREAKRAFGGNILKRMLRKNQFKYLVFMANTGLYTRLMDIYNKQKKA